MLTRRCLKYIEDEQGIIHDREVYVTWRYDGQNHRWLSGVMKEHYDDQTVNCLECITLKEGATT